MRNCPYRRVCSVAMIHPHLSEKKNQPILVPAPPEQVVAPAVVFCTIISGSTRPLVRHTWYSHTHTWYSPLVQTSYVLCRLPVDVTTVDPVDGTTISRGTLTRGPYTWYSHTQSWSSYVLCRLDVTIVDLVDASTERLSSCRLVLLPPLPGRNPARAKNTSSRREEIIRWSASLPLPKTSLRRTRSV